MRNTRLQIPVYAAGCKPSDKPIRYVKLAEAFRMLEENKADRLGEPRRDGAPHAIQLKG